MPNNRASPKRTSTKTTKTNRISESTQHTPTSPDATMSTTTDARGATPQHSDAGQTDT